jgi:hypothetical protein
MTTGDTTRTIPDANTYERRAQRMADKRVTKEMSDTEKRDES